VETRATGAVSGPAWLEVRRGMRGSAVLCRLAWSCALQGLGGFLLDIAESRNPTLPCSAPLRLQERETGMRQAEHMGATDKVSGGTGTYAAYCPCNLPARLVAAFANARLAT